MLFSTRYGAALGVLVLCAIAAAIAFLSVVPGRAQDPSQPRPEYELTAQILSRVDENGRLELCLRTDDGQVVCPGTRFLRPDRAAADRWIASSEATWEAPIDPERIRYSTPTAVAGPSQNGCQPDFEQMLAATWKVETSASFGTAFHIGNGRFITAHHVIEKRPPFVSLIHGDRTVGAAVLAFDPEFDIALLEVATPGLMSNVPTLQLRAPTQKDVGQPVFVVGYPGGEALTLSGGGIVAQVWDDNIQTTSSIRGGNSGGPVIDACGDVIGVLWAGSSSWAYTNSGHALEDSLSRINRRWPSWPRLPRSLPSTLRATDRLVWHYGSSPPQDVDCSEVDGDWWIGVSGIADEAVVRADLERSGWRQVGVCGADGPDDFDNGRTYIAALETMEQISGAPLHCTAPVFAQADATLYEHELAFGALRLTTAGGGPLCPQMNRYSLLVEFNDPQALGIDLGATLVGADGSLKVGTWQGRSYESLTGAANALVTTYWQDWSAASDFRPVALRLAIGPQRILLPLEAPVAQPSSEPAPVTLDQRARIAVRVDDESGSIQACIEVADARHCPADGGVLAYPGTVNRWRESPPISWSVDLPIELSPFAEHIGQPILTCAYHPPGELFAWQFNSLVGNGTAVYVGDRRFLVHAAFAPEGAPWGLVSRGDQSLAVVRIGHDPRNDLALVELFDTEAEVDLGRAAVFGTTSDDLLGDHAHLLSYPAGVAERFTLAVLEVSALTERVLRVEPTGFRRHGSPLIDLCSRQVLAISIGGDDLIRAETVAQSLERMTSESQRPELSTSGPPAHGSAPVLSRPIYAGPLQPQFSGRVCDVHPSERYVQHYAVYLSNIDNPDVWRVYERDGDRPELCDFGDKIFIVEYRADQPPEAVCIEPRRPLSPLSNVELELEAPDGVELLLARTFDRTDCPGLSPHEQTRWFSTHYFKLRNTGQHDFEDMIVRVYNEEGRRYTPRYDDHEFADSDVWGWRVNIREGEPVKIVVTVR